VFFVVQSCTVVSCWVVTGCFFCCDRFCDETYERVWTTKRAHTHTHTHTHSYSERKNSKGDKVLCQSTALYCRCQLSHETLSCFSKQNRDFSNYTKQDKYSLGHKSGFRENWNARIYHFMGNVEKIYSQRFKWRGGNQACLCDFSSKSMSARMDSYVTNSVIVQATKEHSFQAYLYFVCSTAAWVEFISHLTEGRG